MVLSGSAGPESSHSSRRAPRVLQLLCWVSYVFSEAGHSMLGHLTGVIATSTCAYLILLMGWANFASLGLYHLGPLGTLYL